MSSFLVINIFPQIMKETTTYVSWPCRLKIGAKTKKDPHIRIVGKMADVLRAKDKVMARLDSRVSGICFPFHPCLIHPFPPPAG